MSLRGTLPSPESRARLARSCLRRAAADTFMAPSVLFSTTPVGARPLASWYLRTACAKS